jgi:GNAT superfamily N-acetyltransferase
MILMPMSEVDPLEYKRYDVDKKANWLAMAAERYGDVIEEGKPLLFQHWKELTSYPDIPLEPEWEWYRQMDEAGALKIFTLRHVDCLIGYSLFVVRPRHAHYDVSWAVNDIIWLSPDYRNIGVGSAFITYCDEKLRELGVTVVCIDAKVRHPALMYLLKKCGYRTISCGMEKRLR